MDLKKLLEYKFVDPEFRKRTGINSLNTEDIKEMLNLLEQTKITRRNKPLIKVLSNYLCL